MSADQILVRATTMQSGEDELRDLSVADAEELRAFLDKRRWFEAKLKVSRAGETGC